jgi:hypothetical protein
MAEEQQNNGNIDLLQGGRRTRSRSSTVGVSIFDLTTKLEREAALARQSQRGNGSAANAATAAEFFAVAEPAVDQLAGQQREAAAGQVMRDRDPASTTADVFSGTLPHRVATGAVLGDTATTAAAACPIAEASGGAAAAAASAPAGDSSGYMEGGVAAYCGDGAPGTGSHATDGRAALPPSTPFATPAQHDLSKDFGGEGRQGEGKATLMEAVEAAVHTRAQVLADLFEESMRTARTRLDNLEGAVATLTAGQTALVRAADAQGAHFEGQAKQLAELGSMLGRGDGAMARLQEWAQGMQVATSGLPKLQQNVQRLQVQVAQIHQALPPQSVLADLQQLSSNYAELAEGLSHRVAELEGAASRWEHAQEDASAAIEKVVAGLEFTSHTTEERLQEVEQQQREHARHLQEHAPEGVLDSLVARITDLEERHGSMLILVQELQRSGGSGSVCAGGRRVGSTCSDTATALDGGWQVPLRAAPAYEESSPASFSVGANLYSVLNVGGDEEDACSVRSQTSAATGMSHQSTRRALASAGAALERMQLQHAKHAQLRGAVDATRRPDVWMARTVTQTMAPAGGLAMLAARGGGMAQGGVAPRGGPSASDGGGSAAGRTRRHHSSAGAAGAGDGHGGGNGPGAGHGGAARDGGGGGDDDPDSGDSDGDGDNGGHGGAVPPNGPGAGGGGDGGGGGGGGGGNGANGGVAPPHLPNPVAAAIAAHPEWYHPDGRVRARAIIPPNLHESLVKGCSVMDGTAEGLARTLAKLSDTLVSQCQASRQMTRGAGVQGVSTLLPGDWGCSWGALYSYWEASLKAAAGSEPRFAATLKQHVDTTYPRQTEVELMAEQGRLDSDIFAALTRELFRKLSRQDIDMFTQRVEQLCVAPCAQVNFGGVMDQVEAVMRVARLLHPDVAEVPGGPVGRTNQDRRLRALARMLRCNTNGQIISFTGLTDLEDHPGRYTEEGVLRRLREHHRAKVDFVRHELGYAPTIVPVELRQGAQQQAPYQTSDRPAQPAGGKKADRARDRQARDTRLTSDTLGVNVCEVVLAVNAKAEQDFGCWNCKSHDHFAASCPVKYSAATWDQAEKESKHKQLVLRIRPRSPAAWDELKARLSAARRRHLADGKLN